MPLQGRLSATATFLDHLVTKVLPYESRISLTVVYFKDQFFYDTKQLLESKLGSLDGFKWSILLANSTRFSRGLGLQLGVKNATNQAGDLIFFCDVDILMKPEFFSRCRANTHLGRQVS